MISIIRAFRTSIKSDLPSSPTYDNFMRKAFLLGIEHEVTVVGLSDVLDAAIF